MYDLAIDKYMKIEKCSRLVAQANMDAYFQVFISLYSAYQYLHLLINLINISFRIYNEPSVRV